MKLAELLSPDRVVIPLAGKTLREAATVLLGKLDQAGAVEDLAHLNKLLSATLPRDVVMVGPAFLLHFRTDVVSGLTMALGVAPHPVHRENDPSKKARIVVLVVAPPEESSQFLRAISTVARALSRDAAVEGLLAATSVEDALAVLPFVDTEVHDELTVRDVMVPRRVTARPDTPLGQVSELMLAHDVAALPVLSDDDEVLGIVSHRELLQHLLPVYVRRMFSEGRPERPRSVAADPHAQPVRDVMDRSVLCVSESQPLAEVARMMLVRGVDQLPVVRDGAFVGVLTVGDILRRLLGR